MRKFFSNCLFCSYVLCFPQLTEQRYQDVVIAEECFVIQRILRTSRSQKRSLAIQYLKLSYLPKVKVSVFYGKQYGCYVLMVVK